MLHELSSELWLEVKRVSVSGDWVAAMTQTQTERHRHRHTDTPARVEKKERERARVCLLFLCSYASLWRFFRVLCVSLAIRSAY